MSIYEDELFYSSILQGSSMYAALLAIGSVKVPHGLQLNVGPN